MAGRVYYHTNLKYTSSSSFQVSDLRKTCLPLFSTLYMYYHSSTFAYHLHIYIITDCFYIAPFSALEQTHCALVVCHSEGVTVAFHSMF